MGNNERRYMAPDSEVLVQERYGIGLKVAEHQETCVGRRNCDQERRGNVVFYIEVSVDIGLL